MRDVISVTHRSLTTLDNVAPGVVGLRTLLANLYSVTLPSGAWTLIDAGLPFHANRILRWASTHAGVRPSAILLTHGHFDHTGSLKELAEAWDIPVFAHPLEMPYLTGRSKYPPPDPTVGGGAMAVLSPVYPRGPIDVTRHLRELPDDGTVPSLPGWRWIHTPGHTAGHVSYFRDKDRVLLAGDAFVTTKQESLTAVLQQRPELHGPPSYYTSDWDAARLSVQRLADLEPNVFACGHGLPMVGPGANDALHRLADDFDLIARPVAGRYIPTPALTDERGTVRVPPSNVGPLPKILAGAALGGAICYAVTRRRRTA